MSPSPQPATAWLPTRRKAGPAGRLTGEVQPDARTDGHCPIAALCSCFAFPAYFPNYPAAAGSHRGLPALVARSDLSLSRDKSSLHPLLLGEFNFHSFFCFARLIQPPLPCSGSLLAAVSGQREPRSTEPAPWGSIVLPGGREGVGGLPPPKKTPHQHLPSAGSHLFPAEPSSLPLPVTRLCSPPSFLLSICSLCWWGSFGLFRDFLGHFELFGLF